MARWIWTHEHDRIDVRLVGPTLEAAGFPQHIVLYRGFHDVVDTRARIAYWWRERLRIGAELRVENGAVDGNAVNAAAVDAFQIEPIILAELRLSRRFWLGAGYGITIMPSVTVTNSIFNPGMPPPARWPTTIWRTRVQSAQQRNGAAHRQRDLHQPDAGLRADLHLPTLRR